jgi:toxin FitB
MNVVDSSGWLEYLVNGPNARHFAVPVEHVKDLIVPTISVYEVFKRMSRERGSTAAYQAAGLMHQGRVVYLDGILALNAAYASGRRSLPMADSIILATATFYRATLWTQDSDFSAIEGVKYIPKNKSPVT